jgi:hypothetical protein
MECVFEQCVFELMAVELSTGALFKHNKLVRMCGALWDAVFTLPRPSAAHAPALPVFCVQFVVLYNTKFSEGCN